MEGIAEGGAGLAIDEVCRALLKASIVWHEQAKEELQQKVVELMKEDVLKDEEVRSLKRKICDDNPVGDVEGVLD
ncbi:unnamed protein product [Cochlearia groenlandica]